jgi:hypothetical protein
MSGRWHEVDEEMPGNDDPYLVYSSVYGSYYIAKWSPSRGWLTLKGEAFTVITHWNDQELTLCFPIRHSIDEEQATKYGFHKTY